MTDLAAGFRDRRVLVTGGSGFLGARLVEQLEAAGAVLCLLSRESRSSRAGHSQWHSCDLTDGERVGQLVREFAPEVIIHLASLVAGSRDRFLVLPMLQNNLLSTIHLLSAAAEAGSRCVLAGSMEEPSPGEGGGIPCSPYAAAKWAASGYARMYHSLYDVSAVVLRIFMVYGPGQNDRRKLTPFVCEALLRGESPALSSGERSVDWVYVDDVVEAILLAAGRHDLGGETIDVGSGTTATVRDFAERLGRIVDPDIPLQFGSLADRPRETVNVADVAGSEKKLGWRPRTSLDEGLKRTVDWYRNQLTAERAGCVATT